MVEEPFGPGTAFYRLQIVRAKTVICLKFPLAQTSAAFSWMRIIWKFSPDYTSSPAMSIGLSSQEAQQKLQNELQDFTKRKSKVNWFREVKRSPYILISSLQTAVGGILLIAFFIGMKIAPLQGVVLLIVAFLNFAIFCREVHIVKTRRVSNLLSKIKPYFNLPCPWTPHSYPKSSISTERGLLTIPTYRDNSLVNLPTSLLVKGDVIQLNEGVASPADVVLLSTEHTKTAPEVTVQLGEVPPADLYSTDGVSSLFKESISFIPEAEPRRFEVVVTPIITLLDTIIGRGRPRTYLVKEKNLALLVLEVAVVAFYLVTLFWNIIRGCSLRDDFSDSLPELLLGQPVYSVLPLMLLPLSTLWTIVNLYSTTRIIFLVGREKFNDNKKSGHLRNLYATIRQMIIVFFCPARHPNYRCFHILGSLTSVCAMDKEFVLTGGCPLPEKVFFFRTEDIEGEGEGGNDKPEEAHLTVVKEEVINGEEEPVAVKIEITDSTDIEAALNTESEQEHEKSTPNNLLRSDSEIGNRCSSSSELECTSEHTQPLDSLPTDGDNSSPTLSDVPPFEVVTEILDLSPDLEHTSGISFDSINWQSYSNSLKPIGVNILASSHILRDPYSHNPIAFPSELRNHLHKTLCACSLGMEIGVSQFTMNRFDSEVVLYTIGEKDSDMQKSLTTRRANSAVLCNDFTVVHPHLISSVIRDKSATSHLLMSRGSGDMIATCCSDFWDGKDLQPMTNFERGTILEFYNRRNFTSYCIALAYNPLLEVNLEPLKSQQVNLFVPTCHTQHLNGYKDITTSTIDTHISSSSSPPAPLSKPEDIFNQLQCNQVFLGLVSLHFKPKRDIVDLIEDLQVAGIRFVHFTAENDVRGKVFAQKLGLEADWNCHISLAPAQEEGDGTGNEADPDGGGEVELLSHSSSSSSLSSVLNTYMSYNRARLPKGINQVRPHLERVDNVPLLVPLFTDCTTDTIREMIAILQENREIVLCLGNAWNRENLMIFAQADMSMSLVPEPVDTSSCTSVTETCALSTSTSSQNTSSVGVVKGWPTPLEMASYLNSTTCQLSFHRDADVHLLSLISESRHILNSIRLGMAFGLGSLLLLTSVMFLATLFFLPPPLSGSHLFWFTLFLIPLLTLTFLSTQADPRINSQMPNRKRKMIWNNRWFLLLNFILTFFASAVIATLLFSLTLLEICKRDIVGSDCDYLLGNQNSSSPWNGWRGEHEQGLVFAQDLTALFIVANLVVLSVRFLHYTEPLWKLWRYTSWQYVAVMVFVIVSQVVYFAISQGFVIHVYKRLHIANLGSVPVYVWIVGLLWLPLLLLTQELLKKYHKSRFEHLQSHLKLEFETKLGMHSPV